jgi:hypothetical protein
VDPAPSLGPGNGLGQASVNSREARVDLRRPSRLGIGINVRVEALDELARQRRSFL